MYEPGSVAAAVSSKKKKMVVSSASKSVKFQKAKTPSSDKKKFAKTPHSSKTPKLPVDDDGLEVKLASSPTQKKKRKLSFSSADDNGAEVPSPSDFKTKKIKTPVSAKKAAKLQQSLLAEQDSDSELESSFPSAKTPPSVSGKAQKVKTPKSAKKFTKEELIGDNGNDSSSVQKKKKRKLSLAADDGDSEGSPPKQKKSDEPRRLGQKILSNAERMKERQERTVFVGNLPSTMTKEKVQKLFSKFGIVKTARIRCLKLNKHAKNRRAGAILGQTEPGSAASAYVKFSNVEEAKKATSWNGHLIEGRHIRVDMADPTARPAVDKNKAVFLRNLNFTLTEDELWSAFQACGEIASVRIIKDVSTYRSRGLAYVNFTSAGAVELALKMHETEIKGRPVQVHRCEVDAAKTHKKFGDKSGDKKKKDKKKKKGKIVQKAKKDEQSEEKYDFSGKKSQKNKKNKFKKASPADMKKKKLAQVLTGKA